MGQRLPALDLSGYENAMAGAARITANDDAIGRGLMVGAQGVAAGIANRRNRAVEQQKIGIQQGHLDLARQSEQDRRDEMYMKIKTEALKTMRDSVDPEDPQSVASFAQALEDYQTFVGVVSQRYQGGGAMGATAASASPVGAATSLPTAPGAFTAPDNLRPGVAERMRVDSPRMVSEETGKPIGYDFANSPTSTQEPVPGAVGGDANTPGVMPTAAAPAASPAPATDADLGPLRAAFPTASDDELRVIYATSRGKAARDRQAELNKEATDVLVRGANKKNPAAVAAALARSKALRGEATKAAEEGRLYETAGTVLGKDVENDRAIAKQAAAQEEMRKRSVVEADQKEAQATDRLNQALKSGAYERIGIPRDAPPFTSTDDFKARTSFATKSTTQGAGFAHADAAQEDKQAHDKEMEALRAQREAEHDARTKAANEELVAIRARYKSSGDADKAIRAHLDEAGKDLARKQGAWDAIKDAQAHGQLGKDDERFKKAMDDYDEARGRYSALAEAYFKPTAPVADPSPFGPDSQADWDRLTPEQKKSARERAGK